MKNPITPETREETIAKFSLALQKTAKGEDGSIDRCLISATLMELYCSDRDYTKAAQYTNGFEDFIRFQLAHPWSTGRRFEARLIELGLPEAGGTSGDNTLINWVKAKYDPSCLAELAARKDKVAEYVSAMASVGTMETAGAGQESRWTTILQLVTDSAQQGFPPAQLWLGQEYSSGAHVPQDFEKAREWFAKAAQAGLPAAINELGWMYDSGSGVPQDYERAFELYMQAAERGDAKAQANLGWLYRQGLGTRKDLEASVKWLRKSAEEGCLGGVISLGTAYLMGLGVAQDYSQALFWYRRAAEQGSPDGKYNLGMMYHTGRGVEQDYAKALELYTDAVEEGQRDAIVNLASMYQNGQAVQQDFLQATALYFIAGQLGDANSRRYANELLNKMNERERAEVRRRIDDWRAKHKGKT